MKIERHSTSELDICFDTKTGKCVISQGGAGKDIEFQLNNIPELISSLRAIKKRFSHKELYQKSKVLKVNSGSYSSFGRIKPNTDYYVADESAKAYRVKCNRKRAIIPKHCAIILLEL